MTSMISGNATGDIFHICIYIISKRMDKGASDYIQKNIVAPMDKVSKSSDSVSV
jgi:hypothetical protein